MPAPSSQDPRPEGRRIALVIAGAGAIWAVVNMIGMSQGWSPRLLGFFDLAAGGAFVWALWRGFRLWQGRSS